MDAKMSSAELATRPEKHMDLYDAVMSIDSVLSHIDEVIGRIKGPLPPTQTNGVSTQEVIPSFLDVINDSPEAIRTKVGEAHKRLEEIVNLLF